MSVGVWNKAKTQELPPKTTKTVNNNRYNENASLWKMGLSYSFQHMLGA